MNLIVKPALFVLGMAAFLAVAGTAANAASQNQHLVISNENNPTANSVSVYKLTGHSLTREGSVLTGGTGSGNAYVALSSQSVAQSGRTACVFAGDAGSGDIAALKPITTRPFIQLVNTYVSPDGGLGNPAGIGITVSGNYLYANYTQSGSIGVWQVGAGCTLTFLTQLTGTMGLNGGSIDGMVATADGKYLVVAYGDGSVGSYMIGGGSITLIAQENATGFSNNGATPGGVTVSADGNWAIFGDISATGMTQVDVASVGSDGTLGATVTYGGDGTLGGGLDSSGLQLSPDNKFIYLADTLSGQVTTLSFSASSGVVTYPNACLLDLQGYNTEWIFASQVAVAQPSGAGGALYVSEGGNGLSFESSIALLKINSTTGCLTEAPGSPFPDPNSPDLQSISSVSF